MLTEYIDDKKMYKRYVKINAEAELKRKNILMV